MINYLLGIKDYLFTIAIVLLLIVCGILKVELSSANQKTAEVQAYNSKVIAEHEKNARIVTDKAREIENRRIVEREAHIADSIEQAKVEANLVAANKQSQRLSNDAIAKYNIARRSQACSNSQASSGGTSNPVANVVPAELYQWSDGRASELGELLTQSRRRGQLCEKLYDSLDKPSDQVAPLL